MYQKIFCFVLLVIILWSHIGSHIYNFTDYNTWITNIPEKKIYLINERDYCVCVNQGIFFNEYLCTQNIIFKPNYINATEHNINQIIPVETNKTNFNWFIVIYVICLVVTIVIMTFIYSFFNSLYKLIFNPKQLDIYSGTGSGSNSTTGSSLSSNIDPSSNTNSSSNTGSSSSLPSFFDNLYGTSIFGNLSQNIQVKTDSDPSITIDNFIGCSNIKKEINKVINQIKYNNIYKDYFCELPKGILLIGPPGVGKTHLVKTIINATGMKYIFMSGSDFNKIFVGSGSSTVAQLFKRARENKPCLIFIDEADTILKKRSHNESSSVSTEFGSTICKFLAEMDSLKTESGVVVVFATNMDENYIDKGIMRAGRIDQIIHINHPTLEERVDLFKMYLKKLYSDELVDLNKIAKLSYGLTGSDIKKIVNSILINKVHDYLESNPDKIGTMINADTNKDKTNYFLDEDIPINITTGDIDKEISKCILGLERERKINQMNKKIIAYHEAGHAIMAYLIKDSVCPSKICISINSKSLGYTLFPQEDDDLLLKTSIKQLLIEVMILYAGRTSEKIFVGEVTCGAEDDYMKARKILKRLVMNGMIVPEYNFVENSSKDNDKIPEYIEKQLIKINKIILAEVENLLKSSSEVVHGTADKIIDLSSIMSEDIDEIFKNKCLENLINSYDISKIYDLINSQNLLL
jgi:cell division protease FtsH